MITAAPATGEGYARPPIVEAVIERRFSRPIEFDVVNRVRRKFEASYPAVEQTAELSFALTAGGAPPEVRQNPLGYKMFSLDGAAIVLISTQAIAFSRLAPYPGWAEFNAGASLVFEVTREVTGFMPLGRIGVRYVNRLDLPLSEGPRPTLVRMEDYILIRPEYPESLTPFTRGFTLQCVFEVQVPDCVGIMNIATVQSPVPARNGVLFDIDVGRELNVPQKEEDIQRLLGLMRNEKNRIFETSLTPKTKELFR